MVEAVGERLGLLARDGSGAPACRRSCRPPPSAGPRPCRSRELLVSSTTTEPEKMSSIADAVRVERLRDRERLLLPVHEVGAGGVAPAHVAPAGAVRVVLEEQVPRAVVVDQAVGVVHPVPLGREVQVWPVLLVVGGPVGVPVSSAVAGMGPSMPAASAAIASAAALAHHRDFVVIVCFALHCARHEPIVTSLSVNGGDATQCPVDNARGLRMPRGGPLRARRARLS